ncbi:unnamed protein product [Brassica oleracea]
MGALLKTLSSQYYFEVARSLRRQFFSSLQVLNIADWWCFKRCVALTTNLTLVALQGFMMVTDISFEEIIRASYSGDRHWNSRHPRQQGEPHLPVVHR